MSKEIERKFLIDAKNLPSLSDGHIIKQGYVPTQGVTVRVRVRDEEAFLTLKGKVTGISRSEFEYSIPVKDAKHMLDELCVHPIIEKTRYLISYKGHIWELDVFEGYNKGLIVAEIELESEDESFEKPKWATQEVSYDKKYRNSNLISNPYCMWSR